MIESDRDRMLGVYQDLEAARLALEALVASSVTETSMRLRPVLRNVDMACDTAKHALEHEIL